MHLDTAAPGADERFEQMELFDTGEFDQLLDDVGIEVMVLTLDTFFAETEARIERMRGDQSLEEMAREAHSLKGGAATFGAIRLAEMARTIEHNARHGQSPDPDLIEAIDKTFVAVRAMLKRRVESTAVAA